MSSLNKMRDIIIDFPGQFDFGFQKALKTINKKRKNIKGILVCGMGGSALPGSVFYAWLNNLKIDIPVIINRDYSLPCQAKRNWLVVTISYSGNTEETISCFQEALKKKLFTISIGSNGKLERLSQKSKTPFIKIPEGIPPRMALGYQFGALVGISYSLGILSKHQLSEFANLDKIDPSIYKSTAKRLSKKIINKIPLIYASNKLKIIARIWKIAFNENTKIPAFWNYFPELNHNEMTGFEQKNHKLPTINNKFYFIILKDKNDYQRIKKRMDLTAKILKNQGLKGEIIDIKGKNFLEKIFSSIIFAYWVSYYLAQHYNVDPIPVKLVEEFKKKIMIRNS